jgi:hypothetical protein
MESLLFESEIVVVVVFPEFVLVFITRVEGGGVARVSPWCLTSCNISFTSVVISVDCSRSSTLDSNCRHRIKSNKRNIGLEGVR